MEQRCSPGRDEHRHSACSAMVLSAAAASGCGSVRWERAEAVQLRVDSEGGDCAPLATGKKVSPVMKRLSSAAPGNGTAAAAHRGGKDVVLGMAPSERHNGTWLRLCSGSEVELTDNAPSHSAGRRRAALAVRGVAAQTSERRPEREDKATTPRGFAAPLHGLQVGEGF
jgi:hypothetical protein